MNPLKPLADCRLYSFVDTGYLHGRDPADLARRLCDGGADLVQLRAKRESPEEIRRLAECILPVTQSAGVWFVLNDLPDLAAELGASCCHVGQEDFFDAGHTRVEELWGSGRARCSVGLSSHAPEQAKRAVEAGADYVAVGPIYATGTKPGRAPVTLDYVRWAAGNLSTVPWFAIGGIHLGNLDEVMNAGATRICVVSAILNAPDVAGACREFRRRLGA